MVATAGGLHIVGNLAYRGNGWNGFYMVDVSNPTNLVVVARHKSVGQVCDLWVEGSYAYLAEGWEGLTVVDVSRPTRTFYVGKIATRGQARGVEVSGNRVHVAEAGGGLTILSLPSTPLTVVEHPVNVSAAAGANVTLTVRALGREPLSYQWYRGQTGDTSHPIADATEASFTTTETEPSAYWVRLRSGGSVSDSQTAWIRPVPPVSVELLSVWPGYRRGSASKTHVEGNLAYIALGSGALQIWDLTDLASPRFVGGYDPKVSYLSDFCVSGPLAFLVYDGSLDVLDLSKPETPTRLCRFTCSDTNAYISTVTAAGRCAYLSADMFRVLDISDPADPKEAGALSNVWAEAITVRGSYAYLASSSSGLRIVDVANPTQPRLVGSCATTGYVRKVAVNGNFAFVGEEPRWEHQSGGNRVRYGGGLVVIDAANPANPRTIGRFTSADDDYPRDVFAVNNQAYCAAGSAGLQVFDVSNTAAPKLLSECSSNFYASAITLAGQRAYLSAGDAGVMVVDVNSPAIPKLSGTVETAGSAQDVFVAGDFAYLSDGIRGLHILDIRNPQRPTAVGNYRGEARSATAFGTNVFLAPFQVLDVTDPTRPTALGTLEDHWCLGVAVAGNVAYLAEPSRLRAVDVSNPADPKLISAVPVQGAENGLTTSGHNVFLGCGSSGLQIFDVHVPTQLARLGTFYSEYPVRDVALQGKHAYITVSEGQAEDQWFDDAPGLEVIEISDLRRPVRTSKITLPAAARVALLAGNYACVTGDGLRVIDLGDTARPVCVGQHQLGVTTSGLSVNGDLAFVAAGEYGMAIYRLTPQLILQPPVRAGNKLRLSWLGGPGIRLQRTTSLLQPDWQDVSNTDGANGVMVPLSNAASFFRLIRP